MQPKIILHNLSVPYRFVAPGFYDLDQIGIFFASKGDVVITRKRVPTAYRRYLDTLGYETKQMHFIASTATIDSTSRAIFQADDIIKQVKEYRQRQAAAYILDSFMLTEAEEVWAQKLGINFLGEGRDYYRFGTKSNFRSAMKRYGFPIPRGFENRQNEIDGALAAAWLFLRGATAVVTKQDEGVAGLGTRRFTGRDFISHASALKELFPINKNLGVKPLNSSCFIVEEWHETVVCSPSIQFFINEIGEVSIVSLHQQLFGSDKLRYTGCSSVDFLDKTVVPCLRQEGTQIITQLAVEGLRGHCGLNAIVLSDNRILWTELNPRRVMSSYPFAIAQKLQEQIKQPISYTTAHMSKDIWRGVSIEVVLNYLDPVLYTPTRQCGVIPFQYHFLEHLGEVTLMCIGRNRAEVDYVRRGAFAR